MLWFVVRKGDGTVDQEGWRAVGMDVEGGVWDGLGCYIWRGPGWRCMYAS